MGPFKTATIWTFMSFIVCSGKIGVASTQTLTTDYYKTTFNAGENGPATSDRSATTLSTHGATTSTSPTSIDDGATDILLPTSGVDIANKTTDHSYDDEETGTTISTAASSLRDGAAGVALSTSGVDGASMTTPMHTKEENGANSTASNEMNSDSADSVHSIGEKRTSDAIMSSDVINSSTESPEFDLGESEWMWSRLTWEWDIILQLVSAIIGIIGNSLVIVVIFTRRASGRSTDLLIGNLAIADLVTSVAIIPYPTPTSVPHTWQGMFWCLVMFQNLPLWLPVTASSYVLMAISIERYIAVVYPLRFSQIVTVRRVTIVVGLIWLIAMLSLLFGFFVTGIDPTYGYCTLTVTTQQGLAAVGSYWFCLRMVIPVVTMLVTQSMIAVELHRQSKHFRGESSSTNSFHIVARNRVLKVMLEIIIVYVVCWLPNQVAFLGTMVGLIEWGVYIGSPLHRVLTVIGFFNSCLNPFIYAAQHPQFRVAIQEFFRGRTNKNAAVFSEHRPDSSDKRRYQSKDTSSV